MSITQSSSVLPTHFLLRRLHSLAGLVPVGVFLLEHIFTNAISLAGAASYDKRIADLQALPFVVLIEILFILLPLVFHAVYGIVIAFESRGNPHQYPHADNIRYTLQRLTGMMALVFIGWHFYATRWLSYTTQTPMTYEWMGKILANHLAAWGYFVGSLAVTFHFCNGIWSALIVWGVTVSSNAQRLSLKISALLFVFLSLVNALVILNFAFPVGETRPVVIGLVLDFVRLKLFGTL